ncbi:uncharacterized protein AMSG_10716 [Thecamonas trahens ATCC 50062]|uniref:Uncharacterized protein n=1 Tax=Thecamonas trahens ATCC 50062 TaxID=461836 RepID=A0A0L0DS70_THETB|nr:hypothetical protein AMSG_10716 [Thecamonas trahens ATCC 50062]KNC55115.1 hypothetical protein AMSG_10716 [Thecamonas trahens ATCC 50062]|eukprot:XP_013753296.1 hypothetical protein AMSG_10716 [Thecamonas trahens ATCC 50062]
MELLVLVKADAPNVLEEVKQLVLEADSDVNARDHTMATALHCAAQTGQEDVLLFLIGKGASVRAQDNKGHTPLHVAILSNQVATAALLVEFSLASDLLIKDINDKTPLDMAATTPAMNQVVALDRALD